MSQAVRVEGYVKGGVRTLPYGTIWFGADNTTISSYFGGFTEGSNLSIISLMDINRTAQPYAVTVWYVK